jgi:hypothetical protein
MDLHQLVVHLIHPIGSERRWSAQGFSHDGLGLTLLSAGWGSHLLFLSLGGGEVHHQDPLYLRPGLMPRWHMWLDRINGLLAGKLASSWRCLLLGGGLSSMGLHLLPSVASMASFDEEVGFLLQHRHPWGNRHCGLCGQSVFHPWCGRGDSERSPRATPFGGRDAEASFPTRRYEEHLGRSVDALLRVELMKAVLQIPLPGTPTDGVFCTNKIQGGQDHVFLF